MSASPKEASVDDSTPSSSDFPTGQTVPFPFDTPYPQQVDFMNALLNGLKQKIDSNTDDSNNKKSTTVLLLESPTGTGKSLSLACAAVSWLRYSEQQDLNQNSNNTVTCKQKEENNTSSSSRVDWLDDWVAPSVKEKQEESLKILQQAEKSRTDLKQEIENIQRRLSNNNSTTRLLQQRENLVRSAVTAARMQEAKAMKRKRKRNVLVTSAAKNTETDDFCVDDYRSDGETTTANHNHLRLQYESDDENDNNMSRRNNNNGDDSTLSALDLLDGTRLDGSKGILSKYSNSQQSSSSSLHPVGGVAIGSGVRKIVYAARTHSQLSQFVGELRRTAFGKDVRIVALGGRQILCGNAQLKKLHPTESSLSEACLDLQQDKNHSCPLLNSKQAIATLALHTLSHPSDIEDASKLGEASHACAYYATRQSLAAAEVVVLPYQLLLSKNARAAIGLELQQSLVLVDEAHNLPEALRSLHSCRLSLPVAQAALTLLAAYTQKYASRLAGRNLYYLGQIRKCLMAFVKHLSTTPTTNANQKMLSAAELLMELKLDNVNLFKILRYLEQSRLPQKLLGFAHVLEKQTQEGTASETGLSKHVSALSVVQSFLEKLTSTSNEGKVVTDWPSSGDDSRSSRSVSHPTLRYVLLYPSAHFQNVLEEARAVALVGGTLRPFAHVAAELLGPDYVPEAARADAETSKNDGVSCCRISSSLTTFTCDHVVSSSNVLLECLSFGPTNKVKLDFRHQSRSTNATCDELGRALLELCKVVPSGMVVFLPSYTYEAHLVRRWKETGLWSTLERLKKVHREPKSSQHVEAALYAYSRDAQASSGALLLSVVGGKMSEGINFANDMARCVMIVGLPYPDITDPELKEKMSTMDRAAATNKSAITGQAYYHNLCMRAVNQSVGRAIRHANDYAAIVLADFRYSSDPRVFSGLPQWLRRGRASSTGQLDTSFAGTISRMHEFFDSKAGGSERTVVKDDE